LDNCNKPECLNPRTANPSCGCGYKQKSMSDMLPVHYDSIDNFPVGMCYVPWQQWNQIYDLEKGFHCGTIFPELNKPFLGSRCC